jgi:hypothetical protein
MSLNTSLHAQPEVDSGSDSAAKVGPPLDRVDLVLAAILALGALAMLWKVVFTPSMLFFRDVFNYTYPCARFIQQMCRHGQLPYWNPYLNCGQPLLENPNLLFFYPYTLFHILLPIDLAYPLFYVVHFALAGIGTFLLARRWGQSRQAAFFAGFVFGFSGPLLSLGNLHNHAACAAWMPWALLATDRAVQSSGVARASRPLWRERLALARGQDARATAGETPMDRGRLPALPAALRPWILLTLVFSLQLLAAEPFTLLATFGLCVAYALYLRGTRRPIISAANLRILTGFVLVGCLMVALCAVQFLPSVALLSSSHRGAQGMLSRETANWSLHPLLLMEMLVPDFYGPALISPTGWNVIANDGKSPYFISVFMGFVPLFFALAGWAFARDRRRNFVAGAAILIFLLALGHFTPLFSLAYLLVPLLSLVRFPVKLLVPFVMLLAILAGWGLDALRGETACWQARRRRALLPLGFLLGCCLLIWTAACVVPQLVLRPTEWALLRQGHSANEASEMAQYLEGMVRLYLPGVAGFLLAGFLLVTGLIQNKRWARVGVPVFAILGMILLVAEGYRANPSVPHSFYDYVPPMVSRFKGSPGTYRVVSLVRFPIAPSNDLQGYVSFQSIPEAAAISHIAQGVFRQKIVLATGSMAQQIEGSLNLDFDDRSLPPFLFDEWIYLLTQAPDALRIDCLLGRTNAKYIIRPTRETTSGVKLVSEVFNGSPQPSYLYENPYFVPRAYVAGTSIFTPSPIETLSWMASPDFDALGKVILAADPGASPAVQGSGPAGQVEVTERQPNRVTLKAELSRPGYVVLLDRYDSNWHARIDGREVPVLRANQLFRAVYAEPGQHVIVFYYHQQGLLAGMFITCITMVALSWLYARNPGLNSLC